MIEQQNKVRTFLCFPVSCESQAKPQGKSRLKQKGIAILIALISISIMIIFSSDLILGSYVNLYVATTNRDNVKAEYMAKSGTNLANFLISIDFALDLFMANMGGGAATGGTAAGGATAAAAAASGMGGADSNADIWGMLNGIPIGGETMEMLGELQKGFNLSAVNDEATLEILRWFDGDFTLSVEDENSKINVNYMAEGLGSDTKLALTALMSCPAEELFLEDRKLTADKLVSLTKDWIDNDKRSEVASGYNNEDDPYTRLQPPYKAKNAQLDSLEELKLIDGWDDDVYTVFSPYLTVYPFQKTGFDKVSININTASRELLACLFIQRGKTDCAKDFELTLQEREVEQTTLVTSASEVGAFLKNVLCYKEGSPASEGVKPDWFTVRSDVYRVTVFGRSGSQERQLTTVIQRRIPDSVNKVMNSCNVLYWKLT